MNFPLAFRRVALLMPVLLIDGSCTQSERTPIATEPDRASDEAAIRAVLAENEAATNRRDAAGVAGTFTPDADLWIAGGPRFVGVDAIRTNEEAFYANPGFQEWHATTETIRFIATSAAIVEQVATTTLDTGQAHENATVVLVRQDSAWKIAAVRVMGQRRP